jgi:integrase
MSVKTRRYRNGGWEVDISVSYADGSVVRERKKAPVSSRSGAKRWGEARERELLLLGPTQPRKDVPTLAEFWPRFVDGYARANRHKPSGIESKQSHFRTHLVGPLGDKRLDRIGDEDVQQLKAAIDGGNKTVNNVLSTLNKALKTAVEWKVIRVMPCTIRLLKVAPPEMSFYDNDEYERLVAAARVIDPRIHIGVLLGGDAGLRSSETIALEQTDADYQRGYLNVQRAEWRGQVGLPKGGRPRRVPMTKRLSAALRAHRHLRGTRVLYRDDGKTATTNVLRGWLEQAKRRAELEVHGAAHRLRHTFCSHLAMRGAPARAIQELAGHKDLTTTQRYMHLSPAAIESAIRLPEQGTPPQTRRAFGDILETQIFGGI